MIHYLDLIRHWVAFIFQPYNFGPNISAAVITGGTAVALWPALRKRLSAAAHSVLSAHHAATVAEVRTLLEDHKIDILKHIDPPKGPTP